jgi:uncharacterized protein YeeX (DUF496 family)
MFVTIIFMKNRFQLSVEEVCVKLGCPQNRQRALDLLSTYIKQTPNSYNLNLVR